jgi:flagellin
MSMSIGNQAGALQGVNQLARRDREMQLALVRLATGMRINRAADNPAGLTISEQMRAQIAGLSRVSDGLEEGVALTQVADGALEQTNALLQKQRDLALQAGNDAVLDPSARAVLDKQFQALGKAIDAIAGNTRYGGNKLLDGSYKDRAIQTGTGSGQSLDLTIASTVGGGSTGFDRQGLGMSGASLSSTEGAADALTRLDTALTEVGRQRGDLGAVQANALESGLRSLAVASQNLIGAESTIRDADFGQESANLASQSILMQAGIATQAQRGLTAQNVLRLLG